MKYAIPITLLTFVIMSPLAGKAARHDYTIIIEPKWHNLDKMNELFGNKLVLAGSIVFRKKPKDTIYLSKLSLRWKGKKLSNLLGSLYRKNLDKKFLPIEEFLISDSYWNKKKQMLVFNFKRPVSLGPTNIFYLVLTVPEQIENILKQGSFFLESHCLPAPFKTAARHNSLTLAFSSIDTEKTVEAARKTLIVS